MSADPLSDALVVADARSVFTGGITAGGDWAIRLPAGDMLRVHAVVGGSCLLVVDHGDTLHLEEGDVVVIDGRREIVVCSRPGLVPVDVDDLHMDPRTRMAHLGDGGDVVAISGHIDISRDYGELLREALPPLILVRSDATEAPTLSWLISRLMEEAAAGLAGADFISDHLAQVLFMQVLRVCLTRAEGLPAGWLRALADERLAPALRLMHGDPSHPWQLTELARAAAMSRATFALRFKEAAGVAPLAYLLNWRMRLATRYLRQEQTPVGVIAQQVGYTSESAFSNAFKRTMGVSPRRYRDNARGQYGG
ncbi:AraC family transcriptional regulator [Streptomyces sp. Li-HN-5-11]|uniref:AraC family transcriptional regulator n=1 Tax=Streptomyces sp. Li-HN-5-11 TaxID=3075432 RepID=UPI0028AF9F0A|nr:AraC family transcriptional regulator [Streptomyces sp. Li-HN-5-11]WNM34784.1 AraC family transcriptional regulator [Streptomyces sp. Li-HN-5-11]